MNKRSVLSILLFLGAAVFAIGFVATLWIDYTVHYPYGSAPFYVYVITRCAELLVPAALCLTAGIALRKGSKEGDEM